jgi:hypothetical protein
MIANQTAHTFVMNDVLFFSPFTASTFPLTLPASLAGNILQYYTASEHRKSRSKPSPPLKPQIPHNINNDFMKRKMQHALISTILDKDWNWNRFHHTYTGLAHGECRNLCMFSVAWLLTT